jgi:hypothetical protein
MPINIHKAKSRRSIRDVPAILVELWLRLRIRWRHNPGFVAAAAAGSIGLLLALAMAIQGGIRLLEDVPPGDELAEADTFAALGEAAALDADDDTNDPFAEPAGRVRSIARSRLRADDESEIGDDDVRRGSPDPAVRPRARKHVMDDDFDGTVTDEIDAGKGRHPLADGDETASDDSRGPHPLDEHPLAAEPSPPRRFPRRPVTTLDEVADSERKGIEPDADDSPDEAAAQPAGDKAARLNLDIAPVFGNEEFGSDDEVEDRAVETATETIRPAANIEDSATGWRNQQERPSAARETSPALTKQSRSVETVIIATPQRKAAGPDGRPRPGAANARLVLQIAGPALAVIDQMCKFEIRVTNRGSAPADHLTLSVELPDELVHHVGQSLEQHIEKLAPGQTYRALVRAQAKDSGKAVLKADLADDGAIVTRSSASVVVGTAIRTAAKADLPDCECLPLNQAR